MSTTHTATARYSINDAVEVQVTDFRIAGFPTVWACGTVTEVTPLDGGLWDVMVVTADGAFSPQIVGKRNGNPRIRKSF